MYLPVLLDHVQSPPCASSVMTRLRTAVASCRPSPPPFGSRSARTRPHRRSCTTPQHHSAGSLLALVIAPKGSHQPPTFCCTALGPSHLRHTSSLPPGLHPVSNRTASAIRFQGRKCLPVVPGASDPTCVTSPFRSSAPTPLLSVDPVAASNLKAVGPPDARRVYLPLYAFLQPDTVLPHTQFLHSRLRWHCR
ncbi:hypothetical protein NDU88_003847 [Pleurodeles waltl]|uniref:Uncharacterized protein n=1 Tax=Pleurodeles waltl TaxID=8319 RepID=A0AAV7MRS1_PLEWA|nr:hypothetical protein NDU88_003847 [Pleurodeles waltl]